LAMIIRKALITNAYTRLGRAIVPKNLTVHNTANPDTSAQNNRDYFNSTTKRVSAHYIVDWNEVVQCIPDNEIALHAGTQANNQSISIEVCESDDPALQQQANTNAARFIAMKLVEYGWELPAIRTHFSWTEKYCPRRLLPMWDEFISEVIGFMPDIPIFLGDEQIGTAKRIGDKAHLYGEARPLLTKLGCNVYYIDNTIRLSMPAADALRKIKEMVDRDWV
jgi:hypothetical protein